MAGLLVRTPETLGGGAGRKDKEPLPSSAFSFLVSTHQVIQSSVVQI